MIFTTVSFVCFDIGLLWFSQRYLTISVTLKELANQINAKIALQQKKTIQYLTWTMLLLNIVSAVVASVSFYGKVRNVDQKFDTRLTIGHLNRYQIWRLLRILFLFL